MSAKIIANKGISNDEIFFFNGVTYFNSVSLCINYSMLSYHHSPFFRQHLFYALYPLHPTPISEKSLKLKQALPLQLVVLFLQFSQLFCQCIVFKFVILFIQIFIYILFRNLMFFLALLSFIKSG